MMKWTKCAIRFLRISRPGVRVPSIAPENAVKSKDFMAFLFCKPWVHGFCTVFARFQNVQRVQIVAKSDKGCRNYRVKNHIALIKNNDDSKLPESETNRRLALLISGPRVRVPGGAPQQQNPNFFPIGEGFGFFVFFGKQNEGSFPTAVCPKPYQKKDRITKVTTVRVP